MQKTCEIRPVRGYSEGFRRKAVAQVRRRLAAGATLEVAGDEIGVEARALAAWLSEERPSFVPVEGRGRGRGRGGEQRRVERWACKHAS